eukprot:COSAG01_NODE_71282_length_256_cov_0.853503_1_plen_45_part_01
MDSNVTRQSWASRLLGSLVGACFGVLVLLGGLALIGWNEYRTIET